jgi:hypothetical protein
MGFASVPRKICCHCQRKESSHDEIVMQRDNRKPVMSSEPLFLLQVIISSKQENHSRSVVDPDQLFFRFRRIRIRIRNEFLHFFKKIKNELKHRNHANVQAHTQKKQFSKGNIYLFFTANGQKMINIQCVKI